MLTDDMLHLLRQMVSRPFDCYVSFKWLENRQSAFSASGKVVFQENISAVVISISGTEFCNEMYLRQCSRRFILAIIHNHFKIEIACERSDIREIPGGVELIATDLQPIKQADLRKYMRVKNVGESDAPLVIEDISLGGLCIIDRKSQLRFKVGDKIQVDLELIYPRMKPKTITVLGIVKRRNERKIGNELGIEFAELKEDIHYWVNTFIQSRLRAVANNDPNSGMARIIKCK